MSRRSRPQLSATQLTAAGAATVMATVAGSYLGVAGTLLGAGLMSAMTTAGGAVVQHYLDRGGRRVRAVTVRKMSTVRRDGPGERSVERPTASDERSGDPRPEPAREQSPPERARERRAEHTVAFGVPRELGADSAADGAENANGSRGAVNGSRGADGVGGSVDSGGHNGGGGSAGSATLTVPDASVADRPRWQSLALHATLIFALVAGGLFLFELATGKPLAGTVRGEPGTGTSLTGGRLLPPAPKPRPAKSGTETPSTSPTSTSSASPTEPTTAPTRPPPRPTPRPPVPPPTSRPTPSITTPSASPSAP